MFKNFGKKNVKLSSPFPHLFHHKIVPLESYFNPNPIACPHRCRRALDSVVNQKVSLHSSERNQLRKVIGSKLSNVFFSAFRDDVQVEFWVYNQIAVSLSSLINLKKGELRNLWRGR